MYVKKPTQKIPVPRTEYTRGCGIGMLKEIGILYGYQRTAYKVW